MIQRKEEILAIECKSAESVKAKSLNLFLKKYNLPWGIRISAKNFGLANQKNRFPCTRFSAFRKLLPGYPDSPLARAPICLL